MSAKLERRTITKGSVLERSIGFARAVRVGDWIAVSGTAPIGADGGTMAPGDVYRQSSRCLEIIAQALTQAGCAISDVVRTRVMLTDVTRWEEAARAHATMFGDCPPATTFVGVSRFIDPTWMVEIEADAIARPPAK